jgi:3-oxoacyl-[acyl-carrier protein] reductase
MSGSLHDKAALISGGSKGIGLAIAKRLASDGARVVISARTEAVLAQSLKLLESIAPGRVFAVTADMTHQQGIERAVAAARRAAGKIDIVVSNVIGHQIEPDGKGPPPGHFQTIRPKEINAEFKQLVLSAWHLACAVVPEMQKRGWGRIINIASGVAREPAWELPHLLPNMARPAAAALHRLMSRELCGTGRFDRNGKKPTVFSLVIQRARNDVRSADERVLRRGSYASAWQAGGDGRRRRVSLQ